VNIEELELSLRTEFEGQFRNVLAGIKQEVSEFQKKFETEFEEHRTKLDRTIGELSSRLPEAPSFDAAFKESVSEHLRLARDDGAQVAAVAFGEAEKLRAETEAPAGGFDQIRDAINEISSKNTQATILQALVEQAAKFAARGAFFIVKNDHFVGWKVFGAEEGGVRDVLFAASADTILSASIRSMSKATAAFGDHSEDLTFLEALNFGCPDEMHAIPLTARGRGVAVLYADAGDNGSLNVEALETLVRVAGLTVELLAASQVPTPVAQPAAPAVEQAAPAVEAPANVEAPAEIEQPAEVEQVDEPAYVEAAAEEVPAEEYSYESAAEFSPEAAEVPYVTEPEVSEPEAFAPEVESFAPVQHEQFETVAEEVEAVSEYTGEVTYELEQTLPYADETPVVEAPAEVESFAPVAEAEPVAEFEFSSNGAYDASYQEQAPEPVVEEAAVPSVEAPAVAVDLNGNAEVATVAEPVVEVAAAEPKKSRFSDRNVDLPIEVPDAERKLHNDARRFARLLVSEIKLYNEAKVTEGREAGDLYDRLKEAIDRSREMYDKRVQPAVASKFDYFHYEVVNSLADGQDGKLGSGYPGATV
jgi:hypothetical protein